MLNHEGVLAVELTKSGFLSLGNRAPELTSDGCKNTSSVAAHLVRGVAAVIAASIHGEVEGECDCGFNLFETTVAEIFWFSTWSISPCSWMRR